MGNPDSRDFPIKEIIARLHGVAREGSGLLSGKKFDLTLN
jgi:hypothetical protein